MDSLSFNPWEAPKASLTNPLQNPASAPLPSLKECYLWAVLCPLGMLFTAGILGAGVNIDADNETVRFFTMAVSTLMAFAGFTFLGFLLVPSLQGWWWGWYVGGFMLILSLVTPVNWLFTPFLARRWFDPPIRQYFQPNEPLPMFLGESKS